MLQECLYIDDKCDADCQHIDCVRVFTYKIIDTTKFTRRSFENLKVLYFSGILKSNVPLKGLKLEIINMSAVTGVLIERGTIFMENCVVDKLEISNIKIRCIHGEDSSGYHGYMFSKCNIKTLILDNCDEDINIKMFHGTRNTFETLNYHVKITEENYPKWSGGGDSLCDLRSEVTCKNLFIYGPHLDDFYHNSLFNTSLFVIKRMCNEFYGFVIVTDFERSYRNLISIGGMQYNYEKDGMHGKFYDINNVRSLFAKMRSLIV